MTANFVEITQKTDEELVVLTLKNQDYFVYLINRYKDKLFRYIRRISRFCDEDIADVLQEVFIKVYQNLNDFDRTLKFSSWIYRITHNEVISFFRKVKARPESVIAVDDAKIINYFALEVDLADDLDKEYLKKSFGNFLVNLAPKYREVIVLRYFEDKSYEEISHILKKSVSSVGTLLRRAKMKLKREIENSNNQV